VVIDQTIAQTLGDQLLQGLEFRINKFDYLARFYINQMVVMRIGYRFISRLTVPEVMPLNNASFFKEPDGSVDRRNRDARVDARRTLVNRIDIRVIRRIREHPGNDPPLLRDAQSLLEADRFDIDAVRQDGSPYAGLSRARAESSVFAGRRP
jgi:hypothetical protein